MSNKLGETYYAIKDPNGRMVCGYESQTGGLYSSQGKAQAYINRKLKKIYHESQRTEVNSWVIVPVKVVEVK